MTSDLITTQLLSAGSRIAAKISFGAAVIFLILLVALHFIEPQIDPSWHMISEYEIGNYGWVMQLAFLCLALSSVSLIVAIRSQVATVGGLIGLGLLMLSAAGVTLAALCVTDPMDTPRGEMTLHGNLHGLGFILGGPGQTIAAVLISVGLRRNQAWSSARRTLLWTAQLPWITLVVMAATIAVLLPQNAGKFGPSVLVGLPNRLYVVAGCVWLMTVAWHALHSQRRQS